MLEMSRVEEETKDKDSGKRMTVIAEEDEDESRTTEKAPEVKPPVVKP